ncbi:MAG: hypothetical protein QM770_09680 [Tepidisphaeraceae bacterium]
MNAASQHTLLLDGIWGRPWRWKRLARRIECEIGGTAEIVYYDMTGRSTFETLGQFLLNKIDSTGVDPVNLNIVAHSMGGLVTRAAHLLRPTLRMRRAVLMNSPLRGSHMAWFLPLAGVRQMRPGSDLYARLGEIEPHWKTPTLTIWCPGDLMILSGWRSRWPVAQQEICCWVPAHIWPAWSRRLQTRIIEFLK